MSDKQTNKKIVLQIYGYAADLIRNGMSKKNVKQKLIEIGLDEESAKTVVKSLFKNRNSALQKVGQKNMLYGALWCIGGLIITFATYEYAKSEGGGRYFVFFGAIIYGAIQFLYGLFQMFGLTK